MQEQDNDLLALKALAHGMPTLDWHAKNGRIEAPMVGEARDGRWFRLNVNCGYSEDNAVVARYASAAMRLAPSLIDRIEQQAARIAELDRIARNATGYVKELESASSVDLSGLKVPEDFNYSTDKGAWPDFGDYVLIEQKRFGVPNEMFVHKVIQRLRSNSWIDVPAQTHKGAALHDSMEDVVRVVCCGVCEDRVEMYRVADCKPHPVLSAPVVRDADEVMAALSRYWTHQWTETNGVRQVRFEYKQLEKAVREVLATGKGMEPAQAVDRYAAEEGLREAVSDFRKATYEFARGQDPADHSRMMEAQKRIFDEARSLIAPSTPSQAWEGELPEAPIRVGDFSYYRAEQVRKAIGAAVAGVREQALKEAEGIARTFDPGSADGHDIAEAIRSLSSNPVSLTEKWISVEERLPDVGAWVNVLVDRELGDFFDRQNKPRFDVYGAQLRSIDGEGYAEWQRWRMADGGPMGSLNHVSHWMPLPQPPASNGNGEGGAA